jgi:hypothetical protein
MFGSKKRQIETYLILDNFSVELDRKCQLAVTFATNLNFSQESLMHRLEEQETKNLKTNHHDIELSVKDGCSLFSITSIYLSIPFHYLLMGNKTEQSFLF